MLQHISSRTTMFYIWNHVTLQFASTPPFHTITSQSATCSTSHSPHLTPFHTTPTFNITAYFTPQHISHCITSPPLDFTSHHHIWHHTTITQHTAYATFFITIPHHHISHHIVIFHILHYATFHIPGHHIPHHTIYSTTHISITPCLK